MPSTLASAFAEFERQSREKKKKKNSPEEDARAGIPIMEAAIHRARRQAEEALVDRLRKQITAVPPSLFEQLLVMLLRRMSYGGHLKDTGIVLGRAGDNGVDGVVKLDFFGLDCVYMQARRYSDGKKVTSREIREFFGALERSLEIAVRSLMIVKGS